MSSSFSGKGRWISSNSFWRLILFLLNHTVPISKISEIWFFLNSFVFSVIVLHVTLNIWIYSTYLNTFIPEFLKWTFPSLNLDMSTDVNRGFIQKSKTELQTVLSLKSHLIWIYTVCTYRYLFCSARLKGLTLVLLSPDMSCLCKQCRSRSVGFFRSQLIWICTVCHWVYAFDNLIGWKLELGRTS